jgi:hypothetical protein
VSVAASLRIDDVGDDLVVFHTLVGFALWCVWILAVSYCMWSDLRVPAAAPAP